MSYKWYCVQDLTNLNMKPDTFQATNFNQKNTTNTHSHPDFTPRQPSFALQFKEQIQSFNSAQQAKPNLTPSHTQPYQRYSHDISFNTHSHPNNAFVHLRNQISNLRSQFSKLIQKDQSKITDKPNLEPRDKQKKEWSPNRRFNRLPTYSTIELNNKLGSIDKNQKKSETKQNYEQIFRFKTKDSETRQQNQNNNDKDAAIIEESRMISKASLNKKPSFSLLPQKNQLHNAEIQVSRLNDVVKKLQQKQSSLASEVKNRESEYTSKLAEKSNEVQKLKQMLEQGKISLSLKNSLVEKLQVGIAKLQKQNKSLLNQAAFQFQEFNKLKEKYQKQLHLAKQFHRLNIDQIKSKYQQALQQLQTKTQQNRELASKFAEKQVELAAHYHNNTQLQGKIKIIDDQLQQVKHQYQQIKKQQLVLQQKIVQQQAGKSTSINKDVIIAPEIAHKLKICEQENVDLKKRVESYKKSVEQLNHTNNASREKYVQAKQQLKIMRQELIIKEAHINSLYRDISILDGQLRQVAFLKGQINVNGKIIEELNQFIIYLQFQKISSKFALVQQT